MIKMLKQFKNTSKNLPKAVFTQETENMLLSPDFQCQKEDLAVCCLKILFFLSSSIILHNFAHVVLFISCFFRNFQWQFLKWIWWRFLIKHRGLEHNSISLHFYKLCQHVFFILKLTTNEVTSNRMGNLEWSHFSISIFYNSARNVFLMLFFLWISHVTYLNCIVLAFNSNID